MRVTKKDLNIRVKRINNILKENGKKEKYHIEIAYGGYRLCRIVNENSGCRDISYKVTCKELYNTLYTLENVLIETFERQ